MNFQELINEAALGRKIKTHSGLVGPGDIFVALPGVKHDGSRFIPEALDKGAAWVVTGCKEAEKLQDIRLVGHVDPARALGELARAQYRTGSLDLKVVGITGTNGKTTVSYLLEHIFSQNGLSAGVIGTINRRWAGKVMESSLTTPDCLDLHHILFQMNRDRVKVAIMEVSSHALEQNRVAGIDFQAAVFTNLSQDHLDYHRDMEQYFQAKSKLFSDPEKNPSFKAIINADDLYGRRLMAGMPQALSFGLENFEGTKLRGELTTNDRLGLSLVCSYKDLEWTISSPLSGRHNASNLLAAQAAAISLGLGPEQMACLQNCPQIPGRLEKIPNEYGLDIFVDYAHTPDALKNICASVKALNPSRLMVLFGCGGDRDKSKRPAMAEVVSSYADVVFLTSDNPRNEDPVTIIEDIRPGLNGFKHLFIDPDRAEAIKKAVKFMNHGDALIVAGKGHETYQEVKGVRKPFSDVEEIKKALE